MQRPDEEDLPRGIWYEEAKRRYRVRLYHNNHKYFGGYWPSKDQALQAWTDLKEKLASVPKLKRGQREQKELYEGDMKGLCHMLLQEQFSNS